MFGFEALIGHFQVPLLVVLFFIIFINFYLLSSKIISAIARNANGKTELWYALSTSKFEDKIKRFGKLIIRGGAFYVTRMKPTLAQFEAIFPKRAITDKAVAITIVLLAIAPWVSAALGTTAAWGTITFAYAADDNTFSHGSYDLLLLFSGALFVLFSQFTRSVMSLFLSIATLLLFSVWQSLPGCCDLFSGRNSVFFLSFVSLTFLAITRSGTQSALASMIFLASAFYLFPPADERLLPNISNPKLIVIVVVSALSLLLLVRRNGVRKLPEIGFTVLLLVMTFTVDAIVGQPVDDSSFQRSVGIGGMVVLYVFSITIARLVGTRLLSNDAIQLVISILLLAVCSLFVPYFLRITLMGDVLKTLQSLILLPVLCISVIFSICLTATLSNLGFRSGRPVRYCSLDILVSLLTVIGSFVAFSLFATLLEARPGASYLRIRGIVDPLLRSDPSMYWMSSLFLIPTVPSVLHMGMAFFCLSGRMPPPMKELLIRMLERAERDRLGHEDLIVTSVFSAWISLFSTTGIVVLICAVSYLYFNLGGVSVALGNLIESLTAGTTATDGEG